MITDARRGGTLREAPPPRRGGSARAMERAEQARDLVASRARVGGGLLGRQAQHREIRRVARPPQLRRARKGVRELGRVG